MHAQLLKQNCHITSTKSEEQKAIAEIETRSRHIETEFCRLPAFSSSVSFSVLFCFFPSLNPCNIYICPCGLVIHFSIWRVCVVAGWGWSRFWHLFVACPVFFSLFIFCFFFCSFAPLLDMLDFAVCPDAFPHKTYMKRIKKKNETKKTFGLFFTVVSLLYNNKNISWILNITLSRFLKSKVLSKKFLTLFYYFR